MRGTIRTSVAAGILLLAAVFPAKAYIGFAIGTPTPGAEFGNCEAAELLEPTIGNLVMAHEWNPSDIMFILNGGRILAGCNGWSGGFYDCPEGNFSPSPTTPDESVWVLMTMYPEDEPAGLHRGWIFLDVTPGGVADFGFNVTQALWPISAEPDVSPPNTLPGPIAFPPGRGWHVPPGTSPFRLPHTTGIEYRFRAVVELGRDQPGSGPTCRIGGDPVGTGFDDRPLLGYNIYRLMDVPPEISTPQHYLYGPDLRPRTGDEGWVAFYPSGTGAGGDGLDLSNPGGPLWENDNDPTDCFGIEGRDWDGDTDIDHEDDAILIYYDVPGLAPNAPHPDDLATGIFTYVFQPVLKGGPGRDSIIDCDGDTIPDLDLDGDTVPEFISPGGVGLGLTADIEGTRGILISPELVVAPTNVIVRPPGQFVGRIP